MYHNAIVDTLMTHLCPSHIGQVFRLLGAFRIDMLRNTDSEVVGTGNQVASSLPFLLDLSNITKMQLYSLVIDSWLLLLMNQYDTG